MCFLNNSAKPQYLSASVLPIALLAAQVYPIYVTMILIVAFAIFSILYNPTSKVTILISIMLSGYLFWQLAYDFLFSHNPATENFSVILSRFGLIGYLFLLWIWYLCDKTTEHYFKIGTISAKIKIPCIWSGFNDNVLRVSCVFSLVCMIAAITFTFLNRLSITLLCMGIAFSIVNAVLEELLWRGFVLNRLNDCYNEKIALIVMSLTFGIYHYSLGFSIPICLLFSLGGIYFGGITIKSKGLLLATIMHFCMNMLFVSIGIIF